jgi:hypothetical protein
MDEDKFDINALAVTPGIVIALISLVAAILANESLLPDRGRIVFFSTLMSLMAVYTAKPMLKHMGAQVFILSYVLLHLAAVALPFTHDTDYAGPVLLSFVFADYVLLVLGLRWCNSPIGGLNHASSGQALIWFPPKPAVRPRPKADDQRSRLRGW